MKPPARPKPDLIPPRRKPGDRVVAVRATSPRCTWIGQAGTIEAVLAPEADKERVSRPEAMYAVRLDKPEGVIAGKPYRPIAVCWESELADEPVA